MGRFPITNVRSGIAAEREDRRRRSDRVAPAGVVTERAMAPLAGAGSRQRGTGKSGGIDDERSRNPPHHTERPPVS